MKIQTKNLGITALLFFITLTNCGEPPTGNGGNGDDEPDWEDDIGITWRLTSLPGDETNPTWSPDGSTIAFEWNTDWTPDIYLISSDGGNVNRLTYGGGSSPCWSPDGSLILYDDVVDYYNLEGQIYAVDVNGGQPIRITTKGMECAFDPCWSPDMPRITFSGKNRDIDHFDHSALFIMDFPDGEPELFECGTHTGEEWFIHPAWSPDGTKIACFYYLEGEPDLWDAEIALRIIPITGNGGRIPNPGFYAKSTWSPDSTKIAYPDYSNEPRKYCDIFVYSINEKKKTRVTDTTYNAEAPSWSPDRSKIAYANKIDENADYDIWIVELNE